MLITLAQLYCTTTSSLACSWCAVSACIDGTEDASIHHLKSGGLVSEALPTITENAAIHLSEAQRQDDNDRDPFAEDDEEELETNEPLVEHL